MEIWRHVATHPLNISACKLLIRIQYLLGFSFDIYKICIQWNTQALIVPFVKDFFLISLSHIYGGIITYKI